MSYRRDKSPLPSSDLQFIGVDIGGTKCAVSHWDGHKVIETCRVPTGEFPETYSNIEYAIRELRDQRPSRIGVSCGGPLDRKYGVIGRTPNLPSSWCEVPICQKFTDAFGGETTLMNDANACALAEWHFGAGRGTRNMIFLTSGTGFGAGLILNGQLHEGATGDAGEVGHIRLAPNGPIGHGKAGSVEGFCSGGGIARLAKLRLKKYPISGDKWQRSTNAITTKRLAEAAIQGDPFVRPLFDEVADRLGETLAILVDLLNPETIVLGGFFPKVQTLLEKRMYRKFQEEALSVSATACTIQPSRLGDTIGSYGAIAAAIDAYA